MSVRTIVLKHIASVAKQQNKPLRALADDVPLLESGLDSLCMAIIVANLEDELGVDPFGAGDNVAMPKTLGDFIRLYENGAGR